MELLLEPNLYYKRFDKFARGLEKVGIWKKRRKLMFMFLTRN